MCGLISLGPSNLSSAFCSNKFHITSEPTLLYLTFLALSKLTLMRVSRARVGDTAAGRRCRDLSSSKHFHAPPWDLPAEAYVSGPAMHPGNKGASRICMAMTALIRPLSGTSSSRVSRSCVGSPIEIRGAGGAGAR